MVTYFRSLPYIRDIVSGAVKNGELLAQPVEDDKRKKLLRVNPKVVRDTVLKEGGRL